MWCYGSSCLGALSNHHVQECYSLVLECVAVVCFSLVHVELTKETSYFVRCSSFSHFSWISFFYQLDSMENKQSNRSHQSLISCSIYHNQTSGSFIILRNIFRPFNKKFFIFWQVDQDLIPRDGLMRLLLHQINEDISVLWRLK